MNNNIPQGNPMAAGVNRGPNLVAATPANGTLAIAEGLRRIAFDPTATGLTAEQARDQTHTCALGIIGHAHADTREKLNESHQSKMQMTTDAFACSKQQIAKISDIAIESMRGKSAEEMMAWVDTIARSTETLCRANANGNAIHVEKVDLDTSNTLEKYQTKTDRELKAIYESADRLGSELQHDEARSHQKKTNAILQTAEEGKQANKRREEQIKIQKLEQDGQQETRALGEATNRQNYTVVYEQWKESMKAHGQNKEQAFKKFGRNASLTITDPRIQNDGNGHYILIPGSIVLTTRGLF